MIASLSLILLCQLAGEALVRGIGLPMPGPVIGLMLLLLLLLLRDRFAHGIGTARAFQVDAVAGVFAGIAMSLNALVPTIGEE
jgi:holin-like protein